MAQLLLALVVLLLLSTWVYAQSPIEPFTSDEHTLLLYHFDEAQGLITRDASGRGQDAVLQGGAELRAKGKFGGALWLDGQSGSAFLERPEAIQQLSQLTVECWFSQAYQSGRRFLLGDDVVFHFEVDEGSAISLSLYNQGGAVNNSEGKPHQQVGLPCRYFRPGGWHHAAATYDGATVSFFLDGVLVGRRPGPKDFNLGVLARGLWVGCYVDMDYWFSGLIDEARVSDIVRYDPEQRLREGEAVFEMPNPQRPARPPLAIRTPQTTGKATLDLTLAKLYGGAAEGFVLLKPPGKPAVAVGQFQLGEEGQSLALDVSDEVGGEGLYQLGLLPTRLDGYFSLTSAQLSVGGKPLAVWQGEAKSRCTFAPPVLVPLQVGPANEETNRIVLLPDQLDRTQGNFELAEDESGARLLSGSGWAEWWFSTPREQAYRVYLRYVTLPLRPCDLVLDGEDLHPYNMAARLTAPSALARDAFWDYQGATRLPAGCHWLRLQDSPPDIVGVWLEPVDEVQPYEEPWESFSAPPEEALLALTDWQAQQVFGAAQGKVDALTFSAHFGNCDPADLFAGDRVRFSAPVKWNLEPFGLVRLGLQGQGSGHIAALWLVDAKGDEKLIWRGRDESADAQQLEVQLSFEGNDVFDGRRIVAVCLDLDEGNVNATAPSDFQLKLTDLSFIRRDILAEPDGYAQRLESALSAVRKQADRLAEGTEPLRSPGFRPWTQPVVPETHPLYQSTDPRPVKRETFGYGLHFTGARDVNPGVVKHFHEDYDFGDVCWPHIGILPQRKNFETDAAYQVALDGLEQQVTAIRDKGLFLFDIWGYVPNNEAGPTPQVAPEHHEILTRVMGDRFTGYDNGEQDGRYIGGYADRGTFTDRIGGWQDFVRWDESICADNMNYMNATGSLNFSHYYGDRGDRMLGLETAQGLPSDTLLFAFLRGASKQYGRLTYQATSIWNRFGYRYYHQRQTEGANGYGAGPNKGASLSLHKRLFLESYTGGDSIVGTETSQFTADTLENGAPELSPLGAQHLALKKFSDAHHDRGVMYTPIAFMMDFYHGWNPPRHLYRGDKYKIWGKLPYEKGDYQADALFRLVWPTYEDCSYFRDERGFLTPTPFGDIFDVVNNRCLPEILKQYSAVVLLGEVELTPDVVANLTDFVRGGGDLLLDAPKAELLPAELTGLGFGDEASATTTARQGGEAFAEQPYTYTQVTLRGAEPLLVNEAGDAVLTVNTAGKGRVIVCAADFWLNDQLAYARPELVNMEPPYRLLEGAKSVLSEYFGSFCPVQTEPEGLKVRVNCFEGDPNRLLIGLTNNELFSPWHGTVQVNLTALSTARDLLTDTALPVTGSTFELTLPAGDVALVEVRGK